MPVDTHVSFYNAKVFEIPHGTILNLRLGHLLGCMMPVHNQLGLLGLGDSHGSMEVVPIIWDEKHSHVEPDSVVAIRLGRGSLNSLVVPAHFFIGR